MTAIRLTHVAPNDCRTREEADRCVGWYWTVDGSEYNCIGPFSSRMNAIDDAGDCGFTNESAAARKSERTRLGLSR